MFPDSEIAKCYSQGETKVKYVIQFGIAPYIKQLILDDIKGKPFSFLFDETTFRNGLSEGKFEVSTGPYKIFGEKGVSFLSIDTCLLHQVHGSFKHGVK